MSEEYAVPEELFEVTTPEVPQDTPEPTIIEDEPPPTDIKQEDDSEEDKKEYSRKVNERIKKEVAKRYALQKEIDERDRLLEAERNRAAELERKYQETERQARIAQLEFEKQTLFKQYVAKRNEVDDDSILQAAELEDKLSDVKVKLALEQQYNVPKEKNETPPTRTPEVAPSHADEWVSVNQWYITNPTAKAKADEIFRELIEEGYDPEKPGIYKKVSERLRQPAKSSESVVSAPARGQEGSKPPVTGFTENHRQAMILMGKDPNNPEQRKQFMAKQSEFNTYLTNN